MITQEEMKKTLYYDPDTGLITRVNTRITFKVGNLMPCGYLRIKVNGKLYLAHRLAWLYVYGSFPKGQIDHINGIRLDNRICNLRDVTKKENLVNKRIYANSKSGITGVHWHKQHKKWAVVICKDNKTKHLGLFDNLEQARLCRKKADKDYGFHINHGNEVRACQISKI